MKIWIQKKEKKKLNTVTGERQKKGIHVEDCSEEKYSSQQFNPRNKNYSNEEVRRMTEEK